MQKLDTCTRLVIAKKHAPGVAFRIGMPKTSMDIGIAGSNETTILQTDVNRFRHASEPNNAFASCKSFVSNPSVNQL